MPQVYVYIAQPIGVVNGFVLAHPDTCAAICVSSPTDARDHILASGEWVFGYPVIPLGGERALRGFASRSITAFVLVADEEQGVPLNRRFFVDNLSATGETYLVPADRRMEWDAFDTEAEATADPPPIPDYAIPVAILSHIEFERPEDVFK